MSKYRFVLKRIWKSALLAGVGRKIAIHKKIEMTVLVAYDFLFSRENAIYSRPLVVRIGFQTNELTFFKRPVK